MSEGVAKHLPVVVDGDDQSRPRRYRLSARCDWSQASIAGRTTSPFCWTKGMPKPSCPVANAARETAYEKSYAADMTRIREGCYSPSRKQCLVSPRRFRMTNKPAHEIRLGRVRATVWQNGSAETGPRFNTTFSKLYKDEFGQWKDTTSFSREDLPLLGKVADRAHTWLFEQSGQAAEVEPVA
jgi:hypothetical protein